MNFVLYTIGILCAVMGFALSDRAKSTWQSTEVLLILLIGTVWFCAGAVVGAVKSSSRSRASSSQFSEAPPANISSGSRRRSFKELKTSEKVGMFFLVLLLLSIAISLAELFASI